MQVEMLAWMCLSRTHQRTEERGIDFHFPNILQRETDTVVLGLKPSARVAGRSRKHLPPTSTTHHRHTWILLLSLSQGFWPRCRSDCLYYVIFILLSTVLDPSEVVSSNMSVRAKVTWTTEADLRPTGDPPVDGSETSTRSQKEQTGVWVVGTISEDFLLRHPKLPEGFRSYLRIL